MNKKLTFILAALTLSSHFLFAGGFKIGLQGQKQIGMAHTGVGFAQDAATIYFNPAGMSFVGSQLNLSGNALIPSTSFLDSKTNLITNATTQVFTPFSFYGNFKLSKRVNFGLGVYTPFGSGVSYPTDWSGRYILNKIQLQNVFIQPTLSIRLTEHLSIGGGVALSQGNVILEKDLPLVSDSGKNVAHAKLDGKAKGIGFNVGAYYKASDRMSWGVTYHSKVVMKVDKGNATFTNIPAALASSFPEANTFTTELPLPSEWAFGFSYRLTHRLMLAVDANFTQWKSFDSLGFDYGVNSASLTDSKSPRLYKNTSCVRVGLQLKANRNLTFRSGVFYDQTPIKNGYVSPDLPDNDKIGVTGGMSAKLDDHFSLDLSVLYENVIAREQTNIESGLSGTFQTHAISVGAGLNYKFGKSKRHKNY